MKERIYEMERLRQVKEDARRHMRLLNEYRAARARLPYSRYGYMPGDFMDNGAEEDTRRLSLEGTVDAVEALWVAFGELCQSREQGSLRYDDVPWFPQDIPKHEYLRCMSQRKPYCESKDPVKKAYTQLCLRWHPDKFQHKFASSFEGKEWPKVMLEVHSISQGLNSAWEDIQRELE